MGTLAERIQAHNRAAGIPVCARCGIRHDGAAWTPNVGWHDAIGPEWIRRALAHELPASDRTRA